LLSIYQRNNSNNPNFRGLTSQLKRHPYANAIEIVERVEKYSKSKGIAGNLPTSWIEKLPLDNRGERIKDIYAEFGKAMAIIKKGLEWKRLGWNSDIAEDCWTVMKPAQDSINNAKKVIASVLERHGIVSSEGKVAMENIGEGSYGSVQKLTVAGEEFALKVFIPFEKMLESLTKAFNGDEQKALKNRHLNNLRYCHGIYIEANRTHFLNARQNARFNKVFFTDLTNGGMFSRLLDKSTRSPQNPTPIYCYGLAADGEELGSNAINGVVYDFGGTTLREDDYRLLAENNTARRVYNQFRHTPQEKRQSRFDSFSKQYSKKEESWITTLKTLLQTNFKLN
jgi:hypothetical protein